VPIGKRKGGGANANEELVAVSIMQRVQQKRDDCGADSKWPGVKNMHEQSQVKEKGNYV